MSIQCITWAFEQDIPNSSTKFVLVALANYADDQGRCFPGQKRLSRITQQSERTIRRNLKILEELGFIRRQRRQREDGSRTSDEYELLMNLPATVARRPGQSVHPTGQSGQTYRPNATTLPAMVAGHEPSVEPSVKKPTTSSTTNYSEGRPNWPVGDDDEVGLNIENQNPPNKNPVDSKPTPNTNASHILRNDHPRAWNAAVRLLNTQGVKSSARPLALTYVLEMVREHGENPTITALEQTTINPNVRNWITYAQAILRKSRPTPPPTQEKIEIHF